MYDYDPAKRSTSATYSAENSNENFNLSVNGYDKNGNIKGLNRNGLNGSSYGAIDQLTYFYNGNRLTGVTDGATGNADVGDFRAGGVPHNGSSSDYSYWTDGSLKSDANKGIILIDYDTYLNKPKSVTYSDGRWIRFYFASNGIKIKQTNSASEEFHYTPKSIYQRKNNVTALYQISQSEGRVLPITGGFVFEFQYNDHLGNLRASFRDSLASPVNGIYPPPVITQENAYFPFGLEHRGTDFYRSFGLQNQFQYNGKEKIAMFNLGWSDYGFRSLDLQTVRFISVDGLASQYAHNGVYNYAENRPINGIDLDGLEFFSAVENKITVVGARVRFENTSSANSQRVEAIKSEIQSRFNQAVQSANSNYQGRIIYDDKATLTIQLSEQTSESAIKGVGGLGEANIVNNDYTNDGSKDKTVGNVAVNGVHELLHNGGLGHPTDVTRDSNGNLVSDNPIKDTELKLINNGNGTFQYATTSNTAKNIFTNIMQYGKSIINGKQVNNVRGGNENAKTLTPGQLKVVEDNIKKGLVNGEASN